MLLIILMLLMLLIITHHYFIYRINTFCSSFFFLSCHFNYTSTGRDLREGDEANVQLILFLLSLLQYKKPKEILTLEQELLKELKKLKGTGEGDVDCKTQWILTVGGWGNHLCCISSRSEPRHFPVTALESPVDAFISKTPRQWQSAPNRHLCFDICTTVPIKTT